MREALERYLAEDLVTEISRRIVDGYQRVPDTGELDGWAEHSARELIAEKPWDVPESGKQP